MRRPPTMAPPGHFRRGLSPAAAVTAGGGSRRGVRSVALVAAARRRLVRRSLRRAERALERAADDAPERARRPGAIEDGDLELVRLQGAGFAVVGAGQRADG